MRMQVKLPYLKWRDGRPRWEPNARLMKAGWRGVDLRRPDGTWFSAEEARLWVAARMKEVAGAPAAPRAGEAAPAVLTVAALFDRWDRMLGQRLEAETNAAVALTLAPRTVRDYRLKARWLVRRCGDLDAALGRADAAAVWRALPETPAASVSPLVARKLYQDLRLAHGDGMAAAVIRVASIAWGWAATELDLAPVKGFPWAKLKMKGAAPRVRAGTPEEMRALVAAADACGLPEVGDAVILGLWTAQRQGDRLSLVEGQMVGNGDRIAFTQSKTGRRVTVPASADMLARLAALRERKRLAGVTSLHVVIDGRTGRPFDEHAYRKRFAQARAAAVAGVPAAGLPPCPSLADFTDQDLRDTAITGLALAGCTLDEICSISGHGRKHVLSILEHYIDLNAGFADAAIRKLEDWRRKEG